MSWWRRHRGTTGDPPPAGPWPPSSEAVLARERETVEIARRVSPDDPGAVYAVALVLAIAHAEDPDRLLGSGGVLYRLTQIMGDAAEAARAYAANPDLDDEPVHEAFSRPYLAVRLRAIAARLDELADELAGGSP